MARIYIYNKNLIFLLDINYEDILLFNESFTQNNIKDYLESLILPKNCISDFKDEIIFKFNDKISIDYSLYKEISKDQKFLDEYSKRNKKLYTDLLSTYSDELKLKIFNSVYLDSFN